MYFPSSEVAVVVVGEMEDSILPESEPGDEVLSSP